MIEYFSSFSPKVQLAINIFAGIVTIIGLPLAILLALKEFFPHWFSKKKVAQPRLAISLSKPLGGRYQNGERSYAPFQLSEDRTITYAQAELLAYDWHLDWKFSLYITNQSESPAYKVTLLPLQPEKKVSMHLSPTIDYTTAFVPNVTMEFLVICKTTFRATWQEAAAKLESYPFPELRLEYANVNGERYVTVFSATETDNEKKNRYEAIKPAK